MGTERTLTTPIYAAVGAGDAVFEQFNDIISQLRERPSSVGETAAARLEEARTRLGSLTDEVPGNLDELRERLSADELRKLVESYVESATELFNSLAERGEGAVERLRLQPLVSENLDRANKAYSDAVDLTEDALGTVSAQTRAVGERAAELASRTGLKFVDAADAVETAGAKIKEELDDAADDIDSAAIDLGEAAEEAVESAPVKKAPVKKAPVKKAAAKKAPAKPAGKA